VSEAVVDATGDRLTTARSRLASCHQEIRRLRGMRWRRAWTRGRVNSELKLVLPLLRLRERIPDAFWRIFVLVIGTSAFVAVAFLATRDTYYTSTAVGAAAALAAAAFTLLVLLPTDSLLDRRRLVLSQVASSEDYEHQNVCSQLRFLCQRRDTVRSQLKLMRQQAEDAKRGWKVPDIPAEEPAEEPADGSSSPAPPNTPALPTQQESPT
jgi:hypothetical protein